MARNNNVKEDIFATTQPLVSNNPGKMNDLSLSPNVAQDLKGTKKKGKVKKSKPKVAPKKK